MNMRLSIAGAAATAALVSLGCAGQGSAADQAALAAMALDAASLPASPTNLYAEDPAAGALGRRLFFDKRMSADGGVACASCHDPAKGFSDPRPVSLGVGDRAGGRHSMPITAAALHPFQFWDGRADSLWSQPLKAMEGHAEMDFSRVEVAHFIDASYREDYESVFGPMPDLKALPARARPGEAAWDSLSAQSRDDVQRVFANVGKSIEAYERKLTCSDTRFDRWTRGEITLTAQEQTGADSFVANGCTGCHNGPSFSDGKFHDLGIGGGAGADLGRAAGRPLLLADPFNGAGVYSDDRAAGQALLALVATETGGTRAFRTASLRGVGQRQRFGHLGDRTDLRQFITQVYRGGGGGGGGGGRGGGGNGGNGGLDPLLRGVDTDNVDEMIAFLRTLDCPTPPAELLAP
jgi:cytochrome c peroxidase